MIHRLRLRSYKYYDKLDKSWHWSPSSAKKVNTERLRCKVNTKRLKNSNHMARSSFLGLTCNNFGILDNTDGSIDSQTHVYDQIDHSVVSWLYLTISEDIRAMMFMHRIPSASPFVVVRLYLISKTGNWLPYGHWLLPLAITTPTWKETLAVTSPTWSSSSTLLPH